MAPVPDPPRIVEDVFSPKGKLTFLTLSTSVVWALSPGVPAPPPPLGPAGPAGPAGSAAVVAVS